MRSPVVTNETVRRRWVARFGPAAGCHVHPKETQAAELGYTSSPPHLMRTYAWGNGAILLLLDYSR